MRRGIAIWVLCGVLLGACAASSNEPAVTTAPEATPAPTPRSEPIASGSPASGSPAIALPASYKALSKRRWKKIVKAPDSYVGKGYKVWACITQVDAATGDGRFRGYASYHKLKSWFGGDSSMFTGDAGQLADYAQGDIVAMSVVGAGSLSYDSQVGNTTVPAFFVVKIRRLKGSC